MWKIYLFNAKFNKFNNKHFRNKFKHPKICSHIYNTNTLACVFVFVYLYINILHICEIFGCGIQ